MFRPTLVIFRFHQQFQRHLKITSVVRFEVFTAVTMKNAVFWDVALCRSCVNRRSSETSVHTRYTRRLEDGILHALMFFEACSVYMPVM
jgi:hypothetical protein